MAGINQRKEAVATSGAAPSSRKWPRYFLHKVQGSVGLQREDECLFCTSSPPSSISYLLPFLLLGLSPPGSPRSVLRFTPAWPRFDPLILLYERADACALTGTYVVIPRRRRWLDAEAGGCRRRAVRLQPRSQRRVRLGKSEKGAAMKVSVVSGEFMGQDLPFWPETQWNWIRFWFCFPTDLIKMYWIQWNPSRLDLKPNSPI